MADNVVKDFIHYINRAVNGLVVTAVPVGSDLRLVGMGPPWY